MLKVAGSSNSDADALYPLIYGDGRLTVLIYLNPSWTTDNGGALRIPTPVATSSSAKAVEVPDRPTYGDDVDVLPLGGRVAMFYSSEVRNLLVCNTFNE